MTFYYGVTVLSFILLCLAVVTGSINYNKLAKDQQWFLFYLGFIFCIELTTKILVIFREENLVVYPYYIAGEFFILSIMCIAALQWSRVFKFLAIIISGLLFYEYFTLWMSNQSITTGYGKMISHLIIIIMIGIYLIKELKGEIRPKTNKFRIIYISLFFYYTISLFLFLILEQLTLIEGSQAAFIWSLNNIFSASLYGVASYTFYRLWKLT
jgi:hypothetical protein